MRHMISLHKKGMDSRRLLLQQALAGSDDSSGSSTGSTRSKGLPPTVHVMQQNSRLVVLTMEVGAFLLMSHQCSCSVCSHCLDASEIALMYDCTTLLYDFTMTGKANRSDLISFYQNQADVHRSRCGVHMTSGQAHIGHDQS